MVSSKSGDVLTKQKFWRSVFRRVMTKYDDLRSVQGTNSCTGFYKALEAGFSGGGGRCAGIVQVTPSDFIADVELACRRALSEHEFYMFNLLYLEKSEEADAKATEFLGESEAMSMKHRLQEKVGVELFISRIYPVEKYMCSKDVR